MKILKKIIAVFCSIAMSFSLLSVPTAALTGEEVAIGLGVLSFAYELFKDWKAAHPNTPDTEYPGFNPGGMFGGGVGRDELNEKYLDYVSELPATGYNSNGSLLIKAEILEHGYSSYGMSSIYYGCNSHTEARPPQGATVRLSCASDAVLYSLASGYEDFRVSGSFFTAQSLTAPYDGFYQLISSPQCVVKYNLVSGEAGSLSGDFSGWDSRTYFNAGSSIMNSVRCAFYGTDSLSINNLNFFSAHVQFFPRVYKFTPAPSVDVNFETTYNINTRPTSITGGNYGIVGDNGQIVKVEGNTIVNETNNTYYNPSTGTIVPIVDWSYDYSDRSYKVTLESGDTVTVTYGDENVTIQEGDTVYNVYYLVDGSGTEQPPEVCIHEWSETSRTDPTCTIAGQAVSTCSKCQEVKTEPVPALGHDWQVKQSVKTEYDDTGQLVQEGYTIFECSRCQEQYKSTDGTIPPGGGSGTDPGGDEDETLWDKLGKLLGTAVKGILELLGSAVDVMLGGLIDLVTNLFESLKQLVDLFGTVGEAFQVLWTWLPPEITAILAAGVSIFVFVALLKFFMK